MSVSVIYYKRMGLTNEAIALWTSWLYLPWVIKPLWSPLVELLGTRREWIVRMQGMVAVAVGLAALAAPLPCYFAWSLAAFWLMAMASATHDIAADGFYLLALPPAGQAAWVGVRSACYRLASISGQGLLVMLAGALESSLPGQIPTAWAMTFAALSALLLGLHFYHRLALPKPAGDRPASTPLSWTEVWRVMVAFFHRPAVALMLAFLLLYRLGEAQLTKLIQPFLLDSREAGGLGLATVEVGLLYGTFGVLALLGGGLLGGWAISRRGLKFWIWPMALAINLPDLIFVWLSLAQPESRLWIGLGIVIEQFGYGFGFTAYLMGMIRFAEGAYKTAHYALCTGFMALGMMLPGFFSGALQERWGYPAFFIWVCICTLPGFGVIALLRLPAGFGKKANG